MMNIMKMSPTRGVPTVVIQNVAVLPEKSMNELKVSEFLKYEVLSDYLKYEWDTVVVVSLYISIF